MAVMKPDLIMKSMITVVMAGKSPLYPGRSLPANDKASFDLGEKNLKRNANKWHEN